MDMYGLMCACKQNHYHFLSRGSTKKVEMLQQRNGKEDEAYVNLSVIDTISKNSSPSGFKRK